MKTFPSYDYTLCREDGCKKKDTCVRYLTLQKIKQGLAIDATNTMMYSKEETK